jgi:hypothetical protein
MPPPLALPLPSPSAPRFIANELSSHLCYTHPRKYLRAYGIECHVPHREITLFLSLTGSGARRARALRPGQEVKALREDRRRKRRRGRTPTTRSSLLVPRLASDSCDVR